MCHVTIEKMRFGNDFNLQMALCQKQQFSINLFLF